ncbi:MAG: metabolite traffic protein EboE [Planctomycetota bacterium]
MTLAYAANVFPSETLAEVLTSLDGPLAEVKRAVSPEAPLAIELRLGEEAAREVDTVPDAREALRRTIADGGFVVRTINGFPQRAFHGAPVKENVYRPTWLEPERAAYTIALARVLASLLPEGAGGSVSTAPGSFKAFGHGPKVLAGVADSLARTASALADLRRSTGKSVSLLLEPEPGCTLATAGEVIAFWKEFLAPRFDTAPRIRPHLGVTIDIGHLAVEFEDACAAAKRLAAAGIPIGKIHATSAVAVKRPAGNRAALARLAALSNSPYLHQAVGADATGRVIFREMDLPEVLAAPSRLAGVDELRVHFHLPLFMDTFGPLGTTRSETLGAVPHLVNEGLCDMTVLETYTWDVLREQPEFTGMTVAEGVAREWAWAKKNLMTDGKSSR